MKRQSNPDRSKLPVNVWGVVDERERLFCLLHCVCGYSAVFSYKTAFQSKASLNSCSAMASRLLHEEPIREFIIRIAKTHEAGNLAINGNAEKHHIMKL